MQPYQSVDSLDVAFMLVLGGTVGVRFSFKNTLASESRPLVGGTLGTSHPLSGTQAGLTE